MRDPVKVAAIIKRVNDFNKKQMSVPGGDVVGGAPKSSDNEDYSPRGQEDPMQENMPRDIGPCNEQTISGTGSGPVIGRGGGRGAH